MAAVSAMLTSASGAAFETLTAGTSAIEARAAFAAAAIFERASLGRTAAAAAARIGAAIFTTAIFETLRVAPAIIMPAIIVAGTATAIATIATGTAIAAASAEGTLEARAGIAAADASGVAREIFARSARGARGASFAGEEDAFLFGDSGCFAGRKIRGLAAGGFGVQRGDFFGFGVGVIVRGVGLGFGAFGGGAGLHGVFGYLQFLLFVFLFVLVLIAGFLVFFVVLFVVKFRAAYDGISFGVFLRFFVLGFDEFGGERRDLIFVQVDVATNGDFRFDGFRSGGKIRRSFFFGAFHGLGGGTFFGGRRGVGAFFSEQPARQATGEAA